MTDHQSSEQTSKPLVTVPTKPPVTPPQQAPLTEQQLLFQQCIIDSTALAPARNATKANTNVRVPNCGGKKNKTHER